MWHTGLLREFRKKGKDDLGTRLEMGGNLGCCMSGEGFRSRGVDMRVPSQEVTKDAWIDIRGIDTIRRTLGKLGEGRKSGGEGRNEKHRETTGKAGTLNSVKW